MTTEVKDLAEVNITDVQEEEEPLDRKKFFELGGRRFPRVKWWKLKSLWTLYFHCFVLILTSTTNGFDASMMNGLQTLDFWQEYFNYPNPPTLGLLNAIIFVGSTIAVPIAPFFADRIGRKWTVFIGTIVLFIGVALQSASVNIGMFITARFLIGFGVAFARGAAPLLIAELAHPQHRAVITTLYDCMYGIGGITASWTTYGTLRIPNNWSWRLPSVLQAFPSVIQLFFLFWVPESPRFLINIGKHSEAREILEKYHAPASGQEFVDYEYQEINDTIELQKEYSKTSFKELFATRGNRYRVLLSVALGIFSQFSANAIVAYYLHTVLSSIGITSQKEQSLINGCNSILSFFTGIIMALNVERLGRRPLFLFGSGCIWLNVIGMTISSSIYTRNGSETAARAMLGFVFLFGVFYSIAWGGLLYNYSLEIFPYNLRAKGFALIFFIQSIFIFINTYVNPIGMANLGWKYYIFYAVWDGIEFVFVYFFFIETKNVPLEEIAKIFDGEDALVGGGLELSKKEMELHGVKDDYDHVEYSEEREV